MRVFSTIDELKSVQDKQNAFLDKMRSKNLDKKDKFDADLEWKQILNEQANYKSEIKED